MSVTRRIVLAAVLAAAVAGSACAAGSAPPTDIDLVVTSEGPDATRTVEVPLGSRVTIAVDSRIDDILHVHGYEIETPLRSGESEAVSFDATMSGAYEVETHSNSAIWLKLVVR